ncbi:hypothetical protein VM98_33595, partial [Streptomyces rubellomurinus subsp. indigoferus]
PGACDCRAYWRITTPEAIPCYCVLTHLPGGDRSDPAANSVLTVPVYSPKSGDPCYNSGQGNGSWGAFCRGHNSSLALAVHPGPIGRADATDVWHLVNDERTKVEQLPAAPKGAGDVDYNGREYWRITTPDGIQFYFGLNHL